MKPSDAEMRVRRALGKRLVAVRGRFTQEAYATQLGVHVNTLARYERGERLPDAEFFRRLGDNGVNLHWLITGDGTHDQHSHQVSELLPVYEIRSYSSVKASSSSVDTEAMRKSVFADVTVFDAENRMDDVDLSAAQSDTVGAQVSVQVADVDTGDAQALSVEELLRSPHGLFFDEYWLQQQWGLSNADTCIVQVRGDNMEPTIKAGSQVLVDRRRLRHDCEDGLYLLRWGIGLMVRRLQFLPTKQCRVISSNPAYRSFTVNMKAAHSTSVSNIHDKHEKGQTISSAEASDLVAPSEADMDILGKVIWIGQTV